MEDVLVNTEGAGEAGGREGDSRVCANEVSLLLQGPPQDKVTSFPFHPALSPQQGMAAPFSMDFQERGPPSLSESTQSAKSSSTQQV